MNPLQKGQDEKKKVKIVFVILLQNELNFFQGNTLIVIRYGYIHTRQNYDY